MLRIGTLNKCFYHLPIHLVILLIVIQESFYLPQQLWVSQYTVSKCFFPPLVLWTRFFFFEYFIATQNNMILLVFGPTCLCQSIQLKSTDLYDILCKMLRQIGANKVCHLEFQLKISMLLHPYLKYYASLGDMILFLLIRKSYARLMIIQEDKKTAKTNYISHH